MSLDQDGLNDRVRRKKVPEDADVETKPSRLDLKQKELDFHYEQAEAKRRMGLPLSAKDKTAIQSQQVVSGIRQELQQEQKRKRPFVGRKGKVEPE